MLLFASVECVGPRVVFSLMRPHAPIAYARHAYCITKHTLFSMVSPTRALAEDQVAEVAGESSSTLAKSEEFWACHLDPGHTVDT